MQAQAPVPIQAWDDEIDLRQLIECLWRRRWLIVGLVVTAVVAAGVISYAVLPPRYESSVKLDITARGPEELRFDPGVYEALATSQRVFEAMIQLGSLDKTPEELQKAITVRLNRESRLLTITVSAQSPHEAQQLARLSFEALKGELIKHAQERLGQLLRAAERDLQEWERLYEAAREALAAFDRSVDLAIMEARLGRLQGDLVEAEVHLRNLTQNVIPADEALLHALELALADQPEVSEEKDQRVVVPLGHPLVGVTTAEAMVLNPGYLQLNQDLIATRMRLATNRRSVELLQEQLEQLPVEIEQLRRALIAYRAERARLERELNTLRPMVDQARAKRDSLLALQRQAADLIVPAIVADPVLPEAPVAPRKLLNMALAGFVAAFVGVGAALFIEFWSAGQAKR